MAGRGLIPKWSESPTYFCREALTRSSLSGVVETPSLFSKWEEPLILWSMASGEFTSLTYLGFIIMVISASKQNHDFFAAKSSSTDLEGQKKLNLLNLMYCLLLMLPIDLLEKVRAC